MQKQKTLAKWLAVVLLLMVAIACYVALNALFKKDAVQNGTPASAENKTETQISNDSSPSVSEQKLPVYSIFPRRAEQIGTANVQHVGGEADEKFLTSYVLGEKTYVFFSSSSKEYDVKRQGLYLAVFLNDYLMGIEQVAESEEEYLSSTLTKDGILLATKNSAQTIFRQISQSGETTKKAICEKVDEAKLTIDQPAKNARAFFIADGYLGTLTIDDDFAVNKSNCAYKTQNGSIEYLLDFQSHKLLFLQNGNDVEIVSYSQNSGFTAINVQINCSFKQVLPNTNNSIFSFATLVSSETSGETSGRICTFDAGGTLISYCNLQDVNEGVLKQDGDMILLFTPDKEYKFCSHLELVSQEDYAAQNSQFVFDIRLENLEGTSLFVRTDGISFQVVDLDLNVLFSAKGKGVRAEFKTYSQTSLSTSKRLLVYYEARNNDVLTYMAFGGYDAFMVDLAT
ncbi:MAG: hypothetical protein IK048_04885 [Clostridia bacterium]|nr:hypothetical protein [Clostridia bacterium]